ncbi:MAG: DUF2163 domain-containing protein [Pseudomonadota bacterium]
MTKLSSHLETGATTICRAWDITRKDGVVLGFTDHDKDLEFDGVTYAAGSALDGAEIEAHLGLSPDNTAVSGALQHAAITEDDLLVGRFDDAEIRAWRVNWAVPEQRVVYFSGNLGQVEIADGQFTVELRSFSEKLNQPLGRRYLRNCGTELGSTACGVAVASAEFQTPATVIGVAGASLTLELDEAFSPGWFLSGVASIGDRRLRIVEEKAIENGLLITLPEIGAQPIFVGDRITLTAGCDKTPETCKAKFANLVNFQGFPFIPGADSSIATPKKGGGN